MKHCLFDTRLVQLLTRRHKTETKVIFYIFYKFYFTYYCPFILIIIIYDEIIYKPGEGLSLWTISTRDNNHYYLLFNRCDSALYENVNGRFMTYIRILFAFQPL